MSPLRRISKSVLITVLALAPLSSFAGVFISIGIEPPPLPVYVQPECPDDGYLWTPGYWAYGDYGYYWVPGTWVQPPTIGVLWTPGYWGWGDGNYFFHGGYWGPHVGFYGGINYGFGYGGSGYGGGRWDGGRFAYNTAVNRVNVTNIHNTYVDKTVINNNTTKNVSYNGGTNGVKAQPTAQEREFAHEQHIQPTSAQLAHRQAAAKDRGQLASVNGGKPATLAAERPEAYKAVAAQHAQAQPLTPKDKVAATHSAAKPADHETGLPEAKQAPKPEKKAVEQSQPKPKPKPEAKPKPQPKPEPKAKPEPKQQNQ